VTLVVVCTGLVYLSCQTSSSKKTLRIWASFLFGKSVCIWHIKSYHKCMVFYEELLSDMLCKIYYCYNAKNNNHVYQQKILWLEIFISL